MRRRRIFVTRDEICHEKILFSAANLHYLKNVLHFGHGDCVTALDGACLYDVVLELNHRNALIGNIRSSIKSAFAFSVKIDLAFGCIRPGPTEEIIRHCTELGVDSFFPLLFERSNRRPDTARTRWSKIASSACAQSGRSTIPAVNEPMDLEQFLGAVSKDSCLIYFALDREIPPLGLVLDARNPEQATFVIGPEGGLTNQEEARLVAAGFVPASLGPTTLRTETAAIVAVGLTMGWRLASARD